jgi:hypothetical protein
MTEDRLPRGPAELLGYFEFVGGKNPDNHWRNGADMCRWWLAFIANGATQTDIDKFVARLESEPNSGSGWLDLGMQFRHWARTQGFNA